MKQVSDLTEEIYPCEQAALQYHRQGLLVIPTLPGGKRPAVKWRPWLDNLTENDIAFHWRRHPDHEVACILGPRLVVLDADSPEADAAIQILLKRHDVVCFRIVKTARGHHYWFLLEAGTFVHTANYDTARYSERIDVKACRSMVALPPSTGKAFLVDDIEHVRDLTAVGQDFIDAVFAHNGRPPPRPFEPKPNGPAEGGGMRLGEVRELLSSLDPDMGYDHWVRVLMAVHHETGGSDEGFDLVDAWSARGAKYPGSRTMQSKWRSFRPGREGGVTMATLRMMTRRAK